MKWARVIDDVGSGDASATVSVFGYAQSVVRFAITIDNFEHVRLAYGSAVADRSASLVRAAVGRWLGGDGELGLPDGGIIHGRLQRRDAGATDTRRSGSPRDSLASLARLGRGLPPLLLAGRDYVLCLALSVTRLPDVPARARPGERAERHDGWSVDWQTVDGRAVDGRAVDQRAVGAVDCDPFFGQPAGQGKAWVARYRADMAKAAGVLAAIGKDAAAPFEATGHWNGDPGEGLAPPRSAIGGTSGLPPAGPAMAPESGHLAYAWQPVCDGHDRESVLFYEMCPLLVGADGVRRDLAEARPALERLGLVAALDRHLAEHAIEVLEASPDLAVGVQISAQSVSSPAGWQRLFQRLTGDRSVAGRLALSITETASFPDFGAAIRCVARLQALGCAVGIDNFGLGYTSIRELLALSPDLVCIDPFFVRFGLGDASEGAALEHLAGLAGVMASMVVVKGVSNVRQSELVQQKGIAWQQGDYLGAPRLGRPGASLQQAVRCRLPDRVRRKSLPVGAFVKP